MPRTIRMYDEAVAFLSLEQLVWPTGSACPRCQETSRLGRLKGLSTSIGAWKCYACRKPFTAKHGTVFHNSHVPLHVWLQALYLLVTTGQAISSPRLGHVLGVSVRTAWQLKVKIAAGLDAAATGSGEVIVLLPNDRVARGAVDDGQFEKRPGRGVSMARYSRFLAAIEGAATPAADTLFLQALYRLLSVEPRFAPDVDDAAPGQQLELGLFREQGYDVAGAPQPGA